MDADDLLLHDAIAYNIEYLKKETKLAFVSGAHQVSTIDNIKIKTINESVVFDHFQTLLRKNYIGMHATVMFRREAFDEVLYDTTLKACEDYDIYLKIAKKHPIAHHNKVLSVYRRHQENMSNNIPFMLSTVLKVLNRQKHNLSKKMTFWLYKKVSKTSQNIITNYFLINIKTAPIHSSIYYFYLTPISLK